MNYINVIKKHKFKKVKNTLLLEIKEYSNRHSIDSPTLIFYISENQYSSRSKFLEIDPREYEQKYKGETVLYPLFFSAKTKWKQFKYKITEDDMIYLYMDKSLGLTFIYLGKNKNNITYNPLNIPFIKLNKSQDIELAIQNVLPTNVYREYIINKYL
jgi:hypothetical protein